MILDLVSHINPALSGLLLGFSLIFGIGVQNLFVFRQSASGSHTVATVAAVVLCDWLMICLSCFGIGGVLVLHPALKASIQSVGAMYVGCMGIYFLARSLNSELTEVETINVEPAPLTTVIALAVSFSLINPQAIIDMFVIIGAKAGSYTGSTLLAFTGGACMASLAWFSLLAIVGKLATTGRLRSADTHRRMTRYIEFFSGILMLYIALSLWE